MLLSGLCCSDHATIHMSGNCLVVHAEKPLVTQSAIWQQLSAVEMKTGEIAQLPKGAGTLVSHHASRLLVREVYAKFWTLVNDIAGDSLSLVFLV